jgi:hypothetical protein
MVANRIYANPFHETLVEYAEQIEEGRQRSELADLNYKIAKQQRNRRQYPEGLTRQQAFAAGYLTPADLDDEELRVGRCRAANGKIPRMGAKTEMLPRHLYEAMVSEHLQRSNEKLRSQLDIALATMVDIMQDDTAEPKDRMDAAKYLYERVAGKTPDRVQVQVSKAPWEEVIGGIAQISREESRAMRSLEPAIDAEVVEQVDDSQHHESPFYARNPNGYGPRADEAAFDPASEPTAAAEPATRPDEPNQPDATPSRPTTTRQYFALDEPIGDHRITEPTSVPGHEYPQNTSATAPLVTSAGHTNSELLRDEAEAAAELAARRKAARKRIQDAKKKRAIARATGQDAKGHKTIELTQSDNKIQFRVE